jgi:hypothetical protein
LSVQLLLADAFEQALLPEHFGSVHAPFAELDFADEALEHFPWHTQVFLPLCDFEMVFVPSLAFAVAALRKRPIVRRNASLRMVVKFFINEIIMNDMRTVQLKNGSF